MTGNASANLFIMFMTGSASFEIEAIKDFIKCHKSFFKRWKLYLRTGLGIRVCSILNSKKNVIIVLFKFFERYAWLKQKSKKPLVGLDR